MGNYTISKKTSFPVLIQGLLLFFIFSFSFNSCIPPDPKERDFVKKDFLDNSDALWALHHWTQGNLDSLRHGLESDHSTIRYWSAKGIASYILPEKEERLVKLLKDTVKEVAVMAAFAMGQQYNEIYTEDLVRGFISKDSNSVNSIFNATILEAIGKCAKIEYLGYLAGIDSYRPNDDFLVKGQVMGIYRYGQRGIVSTDALNRMVVVATDGRFSTENRTIAANYLQRIKSANLEPYQDLIIQAIKSTKNIDLRVQLLTCLARIPSGVTYDYILSILEKSEEIPITIAALQVLKQYPYSKIRNWIEPLLEHKEDWIRYQAAETIVQTASVSDYAKMKNEKLNPKDEVVRSRLLGGMSKTLPYYYFDSRRQIRDSLAALYGQSKNVAQTLEIIESMSHDWENHSFLLDLFLTTKTLPVKTKAYEVLTNFLWEIEEQGAYPSQRLSQAQTLILERVMEFFSSGDVAAVSILGEKMRKHPVFFQEKGIGISLLEGVFRSLNLPRDLEAARSLAKAISVWKSTDYDEIMATVYSETEGKILEDWGEDSRLLIKTTKGNMKMQLFPDKAPATVSNFLKLVKANYYTRKKFHRIVPNFVVQSGCPRSDGYGSLDFCLRSEFDVHHFVQRGYVGMASAGKHSESLQFFITLSAAPHLDGQYTLFGKIVEGHQILHRLIPDDYIMGIEILKENQ
jgi:cyclophilin family peptidyl-prolyl cis-trans isomerase